MYDRAKESLNIEDAECRGPEAYVHDHEFRSAAKSARKDERKIEPGRALLSSRRDLPRNLPRVLQPRGHQVAVC